MNTKELDVEIAELRKQIKKIQKRISFLERFRSRPTVMPVLHYWRYHQEYWEEYEPLDIRSEALEKAYGMLVAMANDGECSPKGVAVGGYEYSMEDLSDMFPDVEEAL